MELNDLSQIGLDKVRKCLFNMLKKNATEFEIYLANQNEVEFAEQQQQYTLNSEAARLDPSRNKKKK